MNDDINMGVHAFIVKENKILLSQRLKTKENKTYSLPAGHVKNNETLEEAIIREMKEELNIEILEENLELVCIARSGIYVNFGFLIKKFNGKIVNNEKDKVGELKFFDIENLPEIFSGSKGLIELYKTNKVYDKNFNGF